MDFQISPRNLQKQRKRKTDLSSGTLDFPRITEHPTNVLASHLEPWIVSYSNTRSLFFLQTKGTEIEHEQGSPVRVRGLISVDGTFALQGTRSLAAARKSFAAHNGGHGHEAYSVEQRSVRRDGRALREWRGTERLLWCSSTLAQTGKNQGGGGSNGGDALCMLATSRARVVR